MVKIFDRKAILASNNRLIEHFLNYNFLHQEIAIRICENLQIFNRKFANILELSAKNSDIINNLAKYDLLTNIYDCNFIQSYFCENSRFLQQQIDINKINHIYQSNHNIIVADDEYLPFADNSFDLIISNLNLHFVNEVPYFLMRSHQMLKKDGILMISFFGEENLSKLSQAIYKAEELIYNTSSAIMPPTIDIKTAANLLGNAGFADKMSIVEKINIEYRNLNQMLKDIKMMGQSNFMAKKNKRFFSKRFITEIAKQYSSNSNDSSNIEANFEVVFAIAIKGSNAISNL
jgi:NADH dehydrogenase [ubiquinone] 1 alpha subcomplex assembly factor 5